MSKKSPLNAIEQIKRAKRRSVPLIQVITPDQIALIEAVETNFNDDDENYPLICWDVINGFRGLNKLGELALIAISQGKSYKDAERLFKDNGAYLAALPELRTWAKGFTTKVNDALQACLKLPQDCIVFFISLSRYLRDNVQTAAATVQCIMNLRSPFKQPINAWGLAEDEGSRMFIMLSPEVERLPVEIRQDFFVVEEQLPDETARLEKLVNCYESSGLELPDPSKSEKSRQEFYNILQPALDVTKGMSLFAVEQETSLSMTPRGIDIDRLDQRAVRFISQQPGLNVKNWNETFDKIGGNQNLKKFLTRLCDKSKPGTVVFVDEGEKAFAGVAGSGGVSANSGGGDLSGTSQAMHGEFLKWIVDYEVFCILFVGIGGTGKSVFAKATGNYARIKTIEFNIQGMKDKFVGGSQSNIINACRTVNSFSSRFPLLIMTTNDPDALSPELLSRMAVIFYFPMPTEEELSNIWDIHIGLHKLDRNQPIPGGYGWVGRDIANCCWNASIQCEPLTEAAKYVTPASIGQRNRIDFLDDLAEMRGYISSTFEGPFKISTYQEIINRSSVPTKSGRQRKIDLSKE